MAGVMAGGATPLPQTVQAEQPHVDKLPYHKTPHLLSGQTNSIASPAYATTLLGGLPIHAWL